MDALKAFLLADKTAVKSSLSTASQLLDRLSPLIYTVKLQAQASQLGLCHSSGAGGGDVVSPCLFAAEDKY